MSEFGVGALMASNGLIVFIMEMTFVYLVGKKAKTYLTHFDGNTHCRLIFHHAQLGA